MGLVLRYVLGPKVPGHEPMIYWALPLKNKNTGLYPTRPLTSPVVVVASLVTSEVVEGDGERRRRGLSAEHPAAAGCNGQSGLRRLPLHPLVEPASMCVVAS